MVQCRCRLPGLATCPLSRKASVTCSNAGAACATVQVGSTSSSSHAARRSRVIGMEASGLDKTGTGDQTTYCRKTGLVAASSRRGISEQAAALGILRAGELVLGSGPVQGCTALGPRNAHVLTCTLRFLRSGDAQPRSFSAMDGSFARDASSEIP